MPNATMEKIKSLRPDLSDYFFHFTKGSDGKNTLKKILDDMAIKDINGNSYISVTETPILSMIDLFRFFGTFPQPMYAPYGIAINRKDEKLKNLRPAIYGPEKERNLFDKNVLWRYINISDEYDNTWFREWRCQCKELIIDPNKDFVIFKNEDDFDDLIVGDYEPEVEPDDDGGYSVYYIREHKMKGIPIETILQQNISNSNQIEKILEDQPLGYGFD